MNANNRKRAKPPVINLTIRKDLIEIFDYYSHSKNTSHFDISLEKSSKTL